MKHNFQSTKEGEKEFHAYLNRVSLEHDCSTGFEAMCYSGRDDTDYLRLKSLDFLRQHLDERVTATVPEYAALKTWRELLEKFDIVLTD